MSAKKKLQLRCITRKHYESGSKFSQICKTDIYPWAESQKLLSMIVEIPGLADRPTVYMSKSSDR